MATLATVLTDLRSKATDKIRKTYLRHGAPADRTLGVSVADMKLIAKGLKKQQALACDVYESGIFDAMYLAGMVADGAQLPRKQLQAWAEAAAHMPMIFEHTIPWLAVEHPEGRALAVTWMKSKHEHIAAAGWRTYAGIATTQPDAALDLAEIRSLLQSIPDRIATAPNRVKSTMNGFVITIGGYVAPLFEEAWAIAEQLGAVAVDVGDTACEVPLATAYIAKMRSRSATPVKRKTIRC